MNDLRRGAREEEDVRQWIREIIGPASGTYVHMKRNGLFPGHMPLIVDCLVADHANMTILDVSDNDLLGDDATERLCRNLGQFPALRHLDLSKTGFRGGRTPALWALLHTSTALEILALSWNHLCDAAVSQLALVLGNPRGALKSLTLKGANLKDSARLLVGPLCLNTTLEFLDISDNGIGRESIGEFSFVLFQNRGLKTLYLDGNRCDERFAVPLIRALEHNTTLQQLHFAKYIPSMNVPLIAEWTTTLESNVILDDIAYLHHDVCKVVAPLLKRNVQRRCAREVRCRDAAAALFAVKWYRLGPACVRANHVDVFRIVCRMLLATKVDERWEDASIMEKWPKKPREPDMLCLHQHGYDPFGENSRDVAHWYPRPGE